MPKLGSWNESYDAKLLSLLKKGPARGIDPNNLSKDYIEDVVIGKYFQDRKYHSFRRLYCNKIQQYQVDGTLTGGRKIKRKSLLFNHAHNYKNSNLSFIIFLSCEIK